ncbi:MAG: tetratricopeptide repeat protein, partial [Acidobacteriota bacterium]
MSAPSNYPAIKLLQLARESLVAGDLAAAEARFNSVLSHEPGNGFALHHLGLLAWNQGRRAEARTLIEKALQSEPDHVPLLLSAGEMLHDLGEPRPALDIFLRILAIDNSLPEIWNAAGVCFQETRQPTSAIEFFLRALGLKPAFPEALNNLGVVLTEEHDPASAIDNFEQALQLQPDYAACHNNLGVALRQRLEYDRAVAAFEHAFRLDPANADFAGSYGEILSLLYDPRAEALLREALRLRPTDPEKHWNLGIEFLKHGHYIEGWQKYEWRWQRTKNQNPLRPFQQPFWHGEPETDLHNQTLLLHAEQGFGDTFQFLRYLPLILERGPDVILEVQPPIYRLTKEFAARLSPRITVVSHGDPLPNFDFHIPLMSLPTAIATTL